MNITPRMANGDNPPPVEQRSKVPMRSSRRPTAGPPGAERGVEDRPTAPGEVGGGLTARSRMARLTAVFALLLVVAGQPAHLVSRISAKRCGKDGRPLAPY